ncbi:MAG: class I SAM-dependent methyltransferase [Chloroflexi bacterium]|nr:class I SAM-dependent methyltransferase [Chloroflexota bacterium]
MPTQEQIYLSEAEQYEALVSREDYQGNIQKALDEIANVDGLDVLDLGAGTGRLAGLLAPRVRSMRAFDLSAHMLSLTRDRLRKSQLKDWVTAVADHRFLPVPSDSADVMISGWSVSYVAVWKPERWKEELDAWYAEAQRVLRRGGQIVLFESLGTGNETPRQLAHLENVYRWLDETGFQNKWIRTDYKFDSPEQAAEIAGFFFGDEMRARILHEKLAVLPECTGVYWNSLA